MVWMAIVSYLYETISITPSKQWDAMEIHIMFKACEIHVFYNTAFIKPILYNVCPLASPETL